MSVAVGKTKKVTVKNASKVTWKVKSGKNYISLSKKSKKGATIKGKKKGSAKIAVTMKSGKKNIKKTKSCYIYTSICCYNNFCIIYARVI